MITRGAGFFLVVFVVLFCSVGSRDVHKSKQHRRSLNQIRTKLNGHVGEKTVRYNYYGGKKRTFLPIDKINIKKLFGQSQLLSKRKKQKNFEKKSDFFILHPGNNKLKNHSTIKTGKGNGTQSWKKLIEKAFRKDSLADLLQAFEKTNTSLQYKRSNKTGVSSNKTRDNKTENPKALLHEVLENADQKQSSDEKIAAEEIKLGLGKIVSQLQKVLKQDSVFLKNTTKPKQTKKVDLKKLVADMRAKDNNKEDNDESISLSPQQKLKVSDLKISKDLNLDGKSEEQNGNQGMGMNKWSGMNMMNGMNGVNGMNGMNFMSGMNGMNRLNGMNQMNGMNGMNAMNGVNGMNGMNAMNQMNGMNRMNGMNGIDPANGMAIPSAMNGMNGISAMNGIPTMKGFNGMGGINGFNGMNGRNANPAMFMNNVPRMSDLNSDVPDRTEIQKIMYSRFNGDQLDFNNWPSDKTDIYRPPLESFEDEQQEPQEFSQFHHYRRHRAREPYEEEDAEDMRHVAPRYRDEEEDAEDEDRPQQQEYEDAEERATITGHIHLRKHRLHHDPTQRKSVIKRPVYNTETKVANIKNKMAFVRKGYQKTEKHATASGKNTVK
ncbi:uncharacterized protein LOC116294682 [Actinia tenebrosa]|uniref:Uncharacterized protein LOC116294682 n=1 Tax=Actinia tenebrosa TaxID=6105 RepID=A0A6P8HRM2_ACTTE|nr:uncharacterized protein LOC116294682 [Actinia tenebrosa]